MTRECLQIETSGYDEGRILNQIEFLFKKKYDGKESGLTVYSLFLSKRLRKNEQIKQQQKVYLLVYEKMYEIKKCLSE